MFAVAREIRWQIGLVMVCGQMSVAALAWTEVFYSVDWLVECNRHIAVARVETWAQVQVPAGAVEEFTGVGRVTRVLKGHPPQSVTIRGHGRVPSHPPVHRVLLFLSDNLEAGHIVSLSDSELFEPALALDERPLRLEREILEAVQKRLRRMKREGRGAPGTPAEAYDRQRHLLLPTPGWEFCDRPPCPQPPVRFFVVPADEEYRNRYLRRLRAPGVHPRANAARALRHYSGRETIEALRAALQDTVRDSIAISEEPGPRRFLGFYPVRQAAYVSLLKLGIDVQRPEGFVDDSRIEPHIDSYVGDD